MITVINHLLGKGCIYKTSSIIVDDQGEKNKLPGSYGSPFSKSVQAG